MEDFSSMGHSLLLFTMVVGEQRAKSSGQQHLVRRARLTAHQSSSHGFRFSSKSGCGRDRTRSCRLTGYNALSGNATPPWGPGLSSTAPRSGPIKSRCINEPRVVLKRAVIMNRQVREEMATDYPIVGVVEPANQRYVAALKGRRLSHPM